MAGEEKRESAFNSFETVVWKEMINIGDGAGKQFRKLGWDLLRSQSKENNSGERFGGSYFRSMKTRT